MHFPQQLTRFIMKLFPPLNKKHAFGTGWSSALTSGLSTCGFIIFLKFRWGSELTVPLGKCLGGDKVEPATEM